MSITDKTRKTLWARSGNRCAICRIELVQEVESITDKLIIGEECHIVSSKGSGPRGENENDGDLDGYDNLILLCANDHKRVDELTEIYTVEKLRLFKAIHESWVKATLEKDATAFTNDRQNIKSLPQIITGKQLIDIIRIADSLQFDHDELVDEDEAKLIGGLFDELRDYADIGSEMSYTDVAKYEIVLGKNIEALKEIGFYLYGIVRRLRLRKNGDGNTIELNVATVQAVRKDNPFIVGEFLIVKLPTKVKFA